MWDRFLDKLGNSHWSIRWVLVVIFCGGFSVAVQDLKPYIYQACKHFGL